MAAWGLRQRAGKGRDGRGRRGEYEVTKVIYGGVLGGAGWMLLIDAWEGREKKAGGKRSLSDASLAQQLVAEFQHHHQLLVDRYALRQIVKRYEGTV